MAKYEKLKEELLNRFKELEESLNNDEEFETTELSQYDNHPADNATDLTDQHTRLAIRKHNEEEIEDIKAALQAMDEGTYGQCIVCNKQIPIERLEAKPTALTCIEDAQQDIEDFRPVEEDILGPDTDHPVEQEEKRLRDYSNSFEDVESYGSSDTPQDK